MDERLAVYKMVDGFECPAEFWPALGYDGAARFVAIWWEQCGDEASWDDGRSQLIGAEWPAYLALLKHNFPEGHPIGWLLGSSETEATMKIVIDRETAQAWLVPANEAHEVLLAQYPVVDAAEDGVGFVSFEQLMAVIERLGPAGPTASGSSLEDDDDFEAALTRKSRNYEALEAALAGQASKS